jgi:hypothetical protein
VQEANSGQPGILITFDTAKVTTPDPSSDIRYQQCASYEALLAWDKVRSSKRDLFISGTDANDKLKTIAPNVYNNISKKVYFTGMFVGEYKAVSYVDRRELRYRNYYAPSPDGTEGWAIPQTGLYYGSKRIQTIAKVKYHILELSKVFDYPRDWREEDLIFVSSKDQKDSKEKYVHFVWVDFNSYWEDWGPTISADKSTYSTYPKTEKDYNTKIQSLIQRILGLVRRTSPIGEKDVIQVTPMSLAWHWYYGSVEFDGEVTTDVFYSDIDDHTQSVSFQASESVTKLFTKINL